MMSRAILFVLVILCSLLQGHAEEDPKDTPVDISDEDMEALADAIKKRIQEKQAAKEKVEIPREPHPEHVQEGINVIVERIAAINKVIARYSSSIIEGEVLEEVLEFFEQTARVAAYTSAEATMGARRDGGPYKALLQRLNELQDELQQTKNVIQTKADAHMQLLNRVEDLMNYAGASPLSEEVQAAVKRGREKQKPLPKEMMMEALAFEKSTRGRMWFGVTPWEIFYTLLTTFVFFAMYLLLRLGMMWWGMMLLQWFGIHFALMLICGLRAYYLFVFPAWEALQASHLVVHSAVLLGAAGAYSVLQMKAEDFVQQHRKKTKKLLRKGIKPK